ncbi:dihydrofolate reductase family protein [Neorhizobium galegae]|uniref:dihydrofolate reductase family protein n=1 Tax=Neorhizobium galegae TaxID=399 RepID=UPI00351D1E6B
MHAWAERKLEQGQRRGRQDVLHLRQRRTAGLANEGGLVDEYGLCIAPVLLGSGNPLVRKTEQQTELKLLSSNAAANGAVILTCAVGKAA